jgi:hypothetical protein
MKNSLTLGRLTSGYFFVRILKFMKFFPEEKFLLNELIISTNQTSRNVISFWPKKVEFQRT